MTKLSEQEHCSLILHNCSKVRSDFIHYLNNTGIKGEANWDSLTILNGEKQVIETPSPFKTSNRILNEIMNPINPEETIKNINLEIYKKH